MRIERLYVRNYKKMDMKKFMKIIDCSVNVVEGNNDEFNYKRDCKM